MSKKRSKRYEEAAKLVDRDKLYPLTEAIDVVKKFPAAKFDQTLTISFRLGVDPRQSDEMVRGTCPLPNGSGKEVRVLVFAEGEAATQAKNAGADHVGYEAMIKQVQDGWMEFDVVVATPAAMAEVRKLGRQLGPRGLMPNPKVGTVTADVETAVKNAKAGQVRFRADKGGVVHSSIGKASFEVNLLRENLNALIADLQKAKPSAAKGVYLKRVSVSSTMGPGVAVELSSFG